MPINIDRRQYENLSSFELLARQVVEGFITGLHKSPYHGFSVEFLEHRLYNSGESTRHIDWKLYARSEKLFTKRYEEETNLRSYLVIDRSASMFYPEGAIEQTKLGFSVYASAALVELFRRQRDAVGLGVFGSEVELLTEAKSSGAHHRYLFAQLENLLAQEVVPAKSTSAAASLHELAERLHTRSLIVLFSDMFDAQMNVDVLFDALQHLRHNRHEVIVFHTAHNATELNFQFPNRPLMFVDKESGTTVKANPVQLRDSYLSQIKEFKSNLKIRCGQLQIDFVEATVEEGFNPVLSAYLLKRQKLF